MAYGLRSNQCRVTLLEYHSLCLASTCIAFNLTYVHVRLSENMAEFSIFFCCTKTHMLSTHIQLTKAPLTILNLSKTLSATYIVLIDLIKSIQKQVFGKHKQYIIDSRDIIALHKWENIITEKIFDGKFQSHCINISSKQRNYFKS